MQDNSKEIFGRDYGSFLLRKNLNGAPGYLQHDVSDLMAFLTQKNPLCWENTVEAKLPPVVFVCCS